MLIKLLDIIKLIKVVIYINISLSDKLKKNQSDSYINCLQFGHYLLYNNHCFMHLLCNRCIQSSFFTISYLEICSKQIEHNSSVLLSNWISGMLLICSVLNPLRYYFFYDYMMNSYNYFIKFNRSFVSRMLLLKYSYWL